MPASSAIPPMIQPIAWPWISQPFSTEHAAPSPSASSSTGKASMTSMKRESAVSVQPR